MILKMAGMIARAWVGLGQAHTDFVPRHSLKMSAWRGSILHLNPARFLFFEH
jgi:hypothetical protein